MFYTDTPSEALRFGDVVTGYVLATPKIKQPLMEHGNHQYNIDIELSQLSVILSPSCSIGDKKILISPLRAVRKTFFDNDYFNNDLTRLNRRMEQKYSYPPSSIERMSDDEKKEKLISDLVWTFVELFIYEPHERLPAYQIRRRGENQEIKYYMIDFRDVTKVNCDLILKADDSPMCCKILQISDQTRLELSEKIQNFYKRA